MEIDPSLVKKSGKTAEEIKELREIFQLVDTDGRGNISKPALEKLIKMVGIPTNEMDIDVILILNKANDDGDGGSLKRN